MVAMCDNSVVKRAAKVEREMAAELAAVEAELAAARQEAETLARQLRDAANELDTANETLTDTHKLLADAKVPAAQAGDPMGPCLQGRVRQVIAERDAARAVLKEVEERCRRTLSLFLDGASQDEHSGAQRMAGNILRIIAANLPQ